MPLYNPQPPRGAAFPSAPGTNDRFYRTDRNLEYYYDGTRWLTTKLLGVEGPPVQISATSTYYMNLPFRGVYNLYIERLEASVLLSAGSADWTVALTWRSQTHVDTVLSTLTFGTTPGDSANNWYNRSNAVGSVLDANARALSFLWTEVSGAASAFGSPVADRKSVV